MELVTSKDHIEENVATFDQHLREKEHRALDLVKRGWTYVVYESEDGKRFVPSRFVGYVSNSLEQHATNENKNGTETNAAIRKILGVNCHILFDKEFKIFCERLGINPKKNNRSYFLTVLGANRRSDAEFLDPNEIKILEIEATYSEGNTRGILVNRFERDPRIRDICIAKHGWKCTVCGFDFEETFGEIEKKFKASPFDSGYAIC